MSVLVTERPFLRGPDHEWSWPDHPAGMSHAEARIRVPRFGGVPQTAERSLRELRETDLAVACGRLLQRGDSGLQQTTVSGDVLPRHTTGRPLSVRQQLAADLAERNAGWDPEVYDLGRAVVSDHGTPPPQRWGATNAQALATWVPAPGPPADARAVLASRAVAGAGDSRAAVRIASCAGQDLDDDGSAWRAAVARGRALEGDPEALERCSRRAAGTVLDVRFDPEATRFDAVADGPDRIVLTAPLPPGAGGPSPADELYAAARGTLAVEFGPPLTDGERALDALAASLVASRGTSSAGLGWRPPEADLLREAGRELEHAPRSLPSVVERVERVEAVLYPPWPRVIEREQVRERLPERDDGDVPPDFDREARLPRRPRDVRERDRSVPRPERPRRPPPDPPGGPDPTPSRRDKPPLELGRPQPQPPAPAPPPAVVPRPAPVRSAGPSR